MDYYKIILILTFFIVGCNNNIGKRYRVINYKSADSDTILVEEWGNKIGTHKEFHIYDKEEGYQRKVDGIEKKEIYANLSKSLDCKTIRVFKPKREFKYYKEKTMKFHTTDEVSQVLCKETRVNKKNSIGPLSLIKYHSNGQKKYEQKQQDKTIEFKRWNEKGQQTVRCRLIYVPYDSLSKRGGGYLHDGVQFCWADNGNLKYMIICAKGDVLLYKFYSIDIKNKVLLSLNFDYKKSIYKLGVDDSKVFKRDEPCSKSCTCSMTDEPEPELVR